MNPKQDLTNRILKTTSRNAFKDASKRAMNTVGYIIVAEDGWLVKKFKSGKTEKIKPLTENSSKQKFQLD